MCPRFEVSGLFRFSSFCIFFLSFSHLFLRILVHMSVNLCPLFFPKNRWATVQSAHLFVDLAHVPASKSLFFRRFWNLLLFLKYWPSDPRGSFCRTRLSSLPPFVGLFKELPANFPSFNIPRLLKPTSSLFDRGSPFLSPILKNGRPICLDILVSSSFAIFIATSDRAWRSWFVSFLFIQESHIERVPFTFPNPSIALFFLWSAVFSFWLTSLELLFFLYPPFLFTVEIGGVITPPLALSVLFSHVLHLKPLFWCLLLLKSILLQPPYCHSFPIFLCS